MVQVLTELQENVQASIDADTKRCDVVDRMLSRDSSTLVLSGYGASVTVEKGALILHQGQPNERMQHTDTRIDKGRHKIKHIVWITKSGTVSISALNFCRDEHINLHMLDVYGDDTASLLYEHDSDVQRRRVQYTMPEQVRMSYARGLVARKIAHQRETLQAHSELTNIDEACTVIEQNETWITAQTVPVWLEQPQRIMQLEGICAKYYFNCWHNYHMPFNRTDKKKVKPYWLRYDSRLNVCSNKAKSAHEPLNAILNFSYGIVAHLIHSALVISGVDTSCGVLHSERRGRASLVWDIIEPIRPIVDSAVLSLLKRYGVLRGDFVEESDGTVKLAATYAKVVAVAIIDAVEQSVYDEVKAFCTLLDATATATLD